MQVLLNQQRGALFGIDARLMLAIFSGLTVVAGASVGGILSSSKVTGLSKDINTYRNAVESIQHDLGNNIHSITSSSASKNFIALFELDNTYLDTPRQKKWLGPYIEPHNIDSGKAQHRFFGDIGLIFKEHDGTTNCATTNRNPCFYWLTITDVPLAITEKYNEQVDGTETTAKSSGVIQWSGTGPTTLSVRLTSAIKR